MLILRAPKEVGGTSIESNMAETSTSSACSMAATLNPIPALVNAWAGLSVKTLLNCMRSYLNGMSSLSKASVSNDKT